MAPKVIVSSLEAGLVAAPQVVTAEKGGGKKKAVKRPVAVKSGPATARLKAKKMTKSSKMFLVSKGMKHFYRKLWKTRKMANTTKSNKFRVSKRLKQHYLV